MSSAMSAALGSKIALGESEALSRLRPVRDYIPWAIRQFNINSGVYGVCWPSDDESGDRVQKKKSILASMSFNALPDDAVLSKLTGIDYKTALRLAGKRTIDLGFAIYICIEAWSAEIRLVERYALNSYILKTLPRPLCS